MTRAIFVHSFFPREKFYDPANPELINFKDYTPWLLKQLTMRDIFANAPLMPWPYAPDFAKWKYEFERYEPDENTILIGQSLGSGFLARWLSEQPTAKIGHVFLVAPAIYNRENPDPDPLKMKFGEFKLDPDLARKTKSLTIFESTDDMPAIQNTYSFLRENLRGVKFIELPARGHFTTITAGEINREFPELLAEILATNSNETSQSCHPETRGKSLIFPDIQDPENSRKGQK